MARLVVGDKPGCATAWSCRRSPFACTLLVGAGLLTRSFQRVLEVNLGFHPDGVASLRVDPGVRGGLAQRNAYIDDVLQGARAVPGVRAAGLSDLLPLGGDRSWQVSATGQVYL